MLVHGTAVVCRGGGVPAWRPLCPPPGKAGTLVQMQNAHGLHDLRAGSRPFGRLRSETRLRRSGAPSFC